MTEVAAPERVRWGGLQDGAPVLEARRLGPGEYRILVFLGPHRYDRYVVWHAYWSAEEHTWHTYNGVYLQNIQRAAAYWEDVVSDE